VNLYSLCVLLLEKVVWVNDEFLFYQDDEKEGKYLLDTNEKKEYIVNTSVKKGESLPLAQRYFLF
jgi:hypothetical protein